MARDKSDIIDYELFKIAISCERFEFCPEVTAKSVRLGLRIKELPISYDPRDASQRKKIRWRDGVEAIATLWRLRNWRAPDTSATPRVPVVNRLTLSRPAR